MSIDDINPFELEAEQKKISEADMRRRQKELSDIKLILKTPEGRRFIWRIWSMGGIFRNPFTPNANQHGFNSGRMSIGQEIFADVNKVDATAFTDIQQEYVSALLSKKEAQDAR